MGRPPNADGRQTRRAILDAGLVLFAERGFFGTSLRNIAEAVGVRESALYNYFSGKEGLFDALIAEAHEDRSERLAALVELEKGDPRVLLERLTNLVLDEFLMPRQQQLFRVLMSDGMRLAREGRINLIDRMTSGAAPLHDLMRRLTTRGHLRRRMPQLLAVEFMGPLLMWRHWHALHPTGPLVTGRRAFVRAHVAQFLGGACVQVTARRSAAQQRGRARATPTGRQAAQRISSRG